eukprot:CAMPEP_0181186328 /NCGR_PEP_ID=MMETSP1096-20121128/9976_1 /TAXON_ID=156174 ORGANISM="Chrysochromulina ericina, Strain CCMP281" /NCGR_SAMPLE_ID=MMETSP1096 /ASSEMBLY_ACC=CAM_ASM_000453 /LENGTH=343 /DNA_ID=CAMNT_0023275219 /DNA_START=148 /DNA_END=1180 /DNA_ORIENTATION=+
MSVSCRFQKAWTRALKTFWGSASAESSRKRVLLAHVIETSDGGVGSSSSGLQSPPAGAMRGLGLQPEIPAASQIRDLDSGEIISHGQVDQVLSQLTVSRLPPPAEMEDFDPSLEWPTPRDMAPIPVVPERRPGYAQDSRDTWGEYEEATATYAQLCQIIKKALARSKQDRRMPYEARILHELIQDLESTGVLVIADWPSKLLLHAFREIMASFFGKPRMPWHGVLFLHRAAEQHPGSTKPTDTFVLSYIDSMAIDEDKADANLSAAYVAYKRFKEENPWVTHAEVKTELASAEVWLAFETVGIWGPGILPWRSAGMGLCGSDHHVGSWSAGRRDGGATGRRRW